MDHEIWIFLLVFMLIMGLGLFLAGIFTVYFGSGKSRGIGAGLLVGGIVLGLLVFLMNQFGILIPVGSDGLQWNLWDVVIYPGLIYLGAALVGGLAAIGMFLLAIMKS